MLGMKRSISLLLCLLMCLSLFPASAFAEELSDAEQMEEPVIVVEAEQPAEEPAAEAEETEPAEEPEALVVLGFQRAVAEAASVEKKSDLYFRHGRFRGFC